MISRLPGMAHSPGRPGSLHRGRLRWGWPGAVAGAGAIAVTVAIAVGVSQATTAPACAAVLVPVTYHTMVDPPLSGPLSFLVKPGSSAYWLALLVIGAGNAVTSVRIGSATHPAQQLARASYNYWLAPAGMGAGPFTVQVTDAAGHQVTVSGIGLAPGVVQATGTWMYGVGAPTAAPAAAMSAAPAGPSASATAHRTGTPSVRGSRPMTVTRFRRMGSRCGLSSFHAFPTDISGQTTRDHDWNS